MPDQNARQNTFGVVRVRVLDDALELASLNRLRHHIRLKDKSELSRYERTARQPSLRTALACQEVFRSPVSELFAGLNDSVARDARGQMVKVRMRLQRKVGERPDQCDAGKVCLHYGRPAK
jgi:transcriptional regulator with XRE-family HTH domain